MRAVTGDRVSVYLSPVFFYRYALRRNIMVTVHGIDFDISFTDADVIERYENAAMKMREKVADKTKFRNMSTANALREQCKIMEEFIDETLECDSSNILFGGKCDLLDHMKVCDEMNTRAAEAKKALADISNKYVQKQQAARPTDFAGHSHKGGSNKKGGNR